MTTSPIVPLSPLVPLIHSSQHYYSNYASWLIPSRILIGESPSPPEDRNATSRRIHSICHSAKCRTFVCLQAEVPPQTLGAMVVGGGYEDWRRDVTRKVGPAYYYHVRKIMGVGEKVEYVHYGMRRHGGNSGDERGERKGEMVRSMESLKDLMEELKRRVCQGEVIYLHAGGTNDHRTSMVAAGLLGWLYPSIGVVEAVTRTELYCGLQRRKLGFGGDWVRGGDEICPMKRFGASGDDYGKVGCLLSLREEETVRENEDEKKEEVVEMEGSNLEYMSSLSNEDTRSDYSIITLSSPTMRDDFMMEEEKEEESVVFSVHSLDGGQSVNNNYVYDDIEEEENAHEFKPEDILVVNPIKLSDDDDDVYSDLLQETTKYKRNLSLDTTTTTSSSISEGIESNDEDKIQTPATSKCCGEEEEEKEDDVTNQPTEYHLARRQRQPQQRMEKNKLVVNIQQVRYSSTKIQEIKSKLRSMEYQYGSHLEGGGGTKI